MGVFENKNYNYSLTEIKDENERKAVRKSKMEAVKEFFKVDTITELGTGSSGRTIVYQVNHYAVKLICGVTQKCNGENLNSKMTELDCLIAENLNINKNFCREMINMTILSSITDNTAGKLNIIPFTGTATRLSWKCDSFNRIGVDYAIQMPLAKCLTDEMDTYKFQKQDIPKEHPEDFTKILTVGIDLCDALIVMQMHQNKLIHQDIKPQNIFLYHDNYCLGDFGIAREEDSPQFFQEGTRNYWAPEQANGSSVDHRCDIYSLGLVLYELADTVPIHNHYEQRIDDKKLPELESDIPEGLKKVLSNACEYEPDFRYQTAEAMKKDLCRLMEDPDYVPSSTRDNYYSSRKATSQPGRSQMSSGISLPSRNIMRSGPANFQRQRQANRFLQPETAWKAGKLWYEESRRTGCRFAGLNIDKTIMPLSAVSSNAVNFPINVSTNPEETVGLKPLSGVLKYSETLHNMYLIGEGGIGKTTALNSIMEDTYRDKAYHPAENGKNIIPLFVELSKAPADYCSAYHASHSTFIQRYLYMLLGSVDKQYLLSENTEEMSRIMERDDTSIMENIDQLLRADEEHTQYLLLLDGLNEVSKKQLSTKEKDFLGAPSELIVEEIKELLEKHKNITVIITSRADETLSDLDASFERLFLTGVNEDIIKEYLDGCKISSEQVSKNSRLMETLKIPLFLKLYGELYNTADISTPGEILYSFFSERSTKYTARNRIAEIKMDRQKAGDGYETNSLDEKMQGFILDFLLPELGWYMEKNDLYAVDLSRFKQVIDSVLKGEKETDICGIYGRKYFKEYLRGEDPVPNTQTYARHLLALEGPLGEDYVSLIAKYCVYSLGILYANNNIYVSLCFDSTGKYLAIANECDVKIFQFSKLLIQYEELLKYPILGSVKRAKDIGRILYDCLVWKKSILDNEPVLSMKFVNNDSFLAVAYSDQSLCLYDFKEMLSAKKEGGKINSFLSNVLCMDNLHKNDKYLIILCDAKSNIMVLCFDDFKSIDSINAFLINNSNSVFVDAVEATPSGLFISAKREGRLYYDAKLNKISSSYPQSSKELFNYEVFSHTKKVCALGKENGLIVIYSPFLSLNKTIKLSGKHILYIEFSPDDKLLLISLTDNSPEIINMETYEVTILNTFQGKADKAIFSEDGKFIFCCNGNFIEKFSAKTCERINYVKEYCEPYLENLANRALNTFKKNINQYNPSNTIIASPEHTYHQYNSKVTAISCSPDGLYLAVAWSRGEVEIREMETLSCIAILESNNRNVKTISFNDNGEYMAIPFEKSSVKVYSTQTWHCISILHGFPTGENKDPEKQGHSDLVTSILFQKNIEHITEPEKIITASNDGTIKYWNPFSPSRVALTSPNNKYKEKFKKNLAVLWKKFYLLTGVILGDEGTTVSCNDICECEKTLYFVPGLDIDGTNLQNLNPASDLTKKDLEILRLYGAEID